VNALNDYQYTPLKVALRNRRDDIADLLRTRGGHE
jgi:hypothetical protein